MKGGMSVAKVKNDMQGSKRPHIRTAFICVGAVILVTIGTAVAYLFTSGGSRAEERTVSPATGGRGMVITQDNAEGVGQQQGEPVEDGHYRTRMNVDWVFPASGEPSSNAYVENPSNNTHTVYFDLIIKDTKELIYSSPFIPVGARIEKFALNAGVPAGKHSAVVVYHLVDDDYQELSTVSVAVTLNILTG